MTKKVRIKNKAMIENITDDQTMIKKKQKNTETNNISGDMIGKKSIQKKIREK